MTPLVVSKFNVITRIEGGQEYLIFNSLSGEADVLPSEELRAFEAGIKTGVWSNAAELHAKGYLVDPAEEQSRFRRAYLDFLDQREKDEVQLFFVPTYACNFGCSYCYQSGYGAEKSPLRREVIDSYFLWIGERFAGRAKYLTLFGGEPLLQGGDQLAMLQYFTDRTAEAGLDLAVVTNGFYLKESLPWLRRAKLREIQVTIDGPRDVHDRRRPLKGGRPTFDVIVQGVDAALEAGIPVNLRVVVDRENLGALPELARFAIDRGWTRHPGFKTQLGRNYELHYEQEKQSCGSCAVGPGKLQSRIELFRELHGLLKLHPELQEFHRPAFHVAKFLADRGALPAALFDACPGCKTEWAFDHTGRIYSCTATVGKPGESLGRFHADGCAGESAGLDEERVAEWQERDVLSIPECRDCAVQLVCGGGCGSIAKNRSGRLHSPDCRPVEELTGLGAGLYLGGK